MDLSFLIPSKTRRLVLEYFILNPDAELGIRELARKIALAPQLVYRELINMENWGFLFSSKRGNQRAYRVNKRFMFLNGLTDMLIKIQEIKEQTYQVDRIYDLKKTVQRLQKIPVPPQLIPDLKSTRKKPRAYDETLLLGKKLIKPISGNLPKKKDIPPN